MTVITKAVRERRPLIQVCALHEDVFYNYFKPYRHPQANYNIWGGLGLETFGADYDLLQELPKTHLWTVLDGESGNEQWIVSGVHFVNRVCYLVTEISHDGLDVEFRISSRRPSLTPLGLSRQLAKLQQRLIAVQR